MSLCEKELAKHQVALGLSFFFLSPCPRSLIRWLVECQASHAACAKDAARLDGAVKELTGVINDLAGVLVTIRQAAVAVPENNVQPRLPDLSPLQVRVCACVCLCVCMQHASMR